MIKLKIIIVNFLVKFNPLWIIRTACTGDPADIYKCFFSAKEFLPTL